VPKSGVIIVLSILSAICRYVNLSYSFMLDSPNFIFLYNKQHGSSMPTSMPTQELCPPPHANFQSFSRIPSG